MALVTTSCGKAGAPLPPLRLAPGPVSEVSMRRVGAEVQLQFTLPTANLNGPGRIELDRVEIYAVTVAPGTVTPPNRELLTKAYAVGVIEVKPPPVEGEVAAPAGGDKPDVRPGPGDRVTFTEKLTEAVLTPAPLPKAVPAAAPGAAAVPSSAGAPVTRTPQEPGAAAPEPAAPEQPTPPSPAPAPAAETVPPTAPPATPTPSAEGAAPTPPPVPPGAPEQPAAAAAPAPPPYPVRIYAVRGLTRSGRAGQPSERATLPLVTPPGIPTEPKATVTEKAVTLAWTSPGEAKESAPAAFNVYRPKQGAAPLNPKPLTSPTFEVAGWEEATEQCFIVRGVEIIQNVRIEGESTDATCVTPKDTFPPAAPQGLSVLLLEGAIELVWDANREPDLTGYTVLRGDAPGDTLRALTPAPTRDTSFRDPTVKSGARYVYALIAVDRAGNASPQSVRIEGTAR